MVKPKENDPDSFVVELSFIGGGEHLLKVQQALLLGIETVGSHKDHSGYTDHQMAVFILSDLLKQFMLNESQTYVGMVESRMSGRSKPYLDVKRNRPSKACFLF